MHSANPDSNMMERVASGLGAHCGQTLKQSALVEVLPYDCDRVALGAGLQMQGDSQLATHQRQSLNIFAATRQAWGTIAYSPPAGLGKLLGSLQIAASVANMQSSTRLRLSQPQPMQERSCRAFSKYRRLQA